MKMLPEESTATLDGLDNEVLVAATLSLTFNVLPSPATVVITPVLTVTFRIRLLLESAMKMLPFVSRDKPCGDFNIAKVAWPSSPPKLPTPVPATVVITPVLAVTLSILWLPETAIKRLFSLSRAMPFGFCSLLLVAGIPSSLEPPPYVLEPATVEIMPNVELAWYLAFLSREETAVVTEATDSVAAKTLYSASESDRRRMIKRHISLDESSEDSRYINF